MGGIGGGSDGIEPPMATGWRPLVGDPLPPAEHETEQEPHQTFCCYPYFFNRRLLAAELPSPEGTVWAVGGGGGGGAAPPFVDCWGALEPEVPWAALEPAEANLAWFKFFWLRVASVTEDWNCPPKSEEPTKGVDRRVTLRASSHEAWSIEDHVALNRNSHWCRLGRGLARLSNGPMQVVTHCFEDGVSLTMIVQVIDHNLYMPSKLTGHRWCLKWRLQDSAKVRINGQRTDISDLFNHPLLHLRSLKQRRIQFCRDLMGWSGICSFHRCRRLLKSLGQLSHHVRV